MSTPPILRLGRRTCVYGQQGTGKTQLAVDLVCAARAPRLLVLDVNGEWSSFVPAVSVQTGSAVKDYMQQPLLRVPSMHAREAHARPMRCILDVRAGSADLFDWLAGVVWSLGNLLLVIDEADEWLPAREKLSDAVTVLLRRGRHRHIRLLTVSQRPADVHKRVTSQADCVWIGRTTEERDIDYFRSCGWGEMARRLPGLGDYEFLSCMRPGGVLHWSADRRLIHER